MKIVILAAGFGLRFGESEPKPLIQLSNGKSILGLQLDAIRQQASLNDVILVVGYKKEMIMEAFPDLLYVYNPLYVQENTAKSLLRALSKIKEDVLWINGDLIFHPSVLKSILSFKRTCMIVNEGPVGEEEVKYKTNSEGKIREVSKQVAEAQGEALGLNFFTAKDLPRLKHYLAKCAERDYFEKAIEGCIQEGLDVWSLPVPINSCTEIDFHEDLDRANEIISHWT